MKQLFSLLIPYCLLVLISLPATAAKIDIKELEAVLKTRVAEGTQGVGLVVGIINGEQAEIISVGRASKTNDQVLDGKSFFEIGSISKTFTAIILADMVLNKELRLTDPVAKFLPKEVTMPTFNEKQITLQDLATHTSALPRLPSNLLQTDINNPYADYRLKDMYAFLSNYKLTREIGVKTEYSNLGMGLLGHVLALKAGMSYEKLLRQRILKPLSMHDTTISISKQQQSRFATGHNALGNATKYWDIPTLAGTGAIRSTAEDMMKYLAANIGLIKTSISEAIHISHQSRYKFGADYLSIGLAWLITKKPGGAIIWHNGGTGGFRSYLGFDEVKKLGVIVLANSQDNPDFIGASILENKIQALRVKPNKAITLSKQQLALFIGEYELAPNFILTVTSDEKNLFIQATGQPNVIVYAKSKNEFFYKLVQASVTFNVDDKGKVDSLTLHQNGDYQAKKIK